MKMSRTIAIGLTLLGISCSAPSGKQTNEQETEFILTDTTTSEDSVQDNPAQKDSATENTETETFEEELKELPGMTFCDCVKKQQEINKKLEKAETDEAIDAALHEMDELEKGDCKNLLAGNTDSPDKRAEHKRKVAECLGR